MKHWQIRALNILKNLILPLENGEAETKLDPELKTKSTDVKNPQ